MMHGNSNIKLIFFFKGNISYSRIYGKEQNRLFLLCNNCPCRQFALHTLLHRYAHISYVGSSKIGYPSTNHNPHISMAQMSSRFDHQHELEICLLSQVSRPVQWSTHHFINGYQRLFAQG